MMFTILLASVLTLACGAPGAKVTAETTQRSDFQERDEFNQVYQLGPGARVEIASIRGTVEITNSDGPTAEVKIIRSARNRADLEYHKIAVEQTGNGLTVRGVQEPEDRRHKNVQVDHKVILKLPRAIDLSVKSISGWLKGGDIDGAAQVSSISGSAKIGNVGGKLDVSSISGNLDVGNVGADARVKSISGNLRLGQVNGSLEITSVSGGLNATLTSLSPAGIQIRSVSGSIEIGFKSDVNADFKADSVSGEVYLEVPNVVRDMESKSSNVRARIGAGGTPITISSVSGNIRFSRS